MSFSWGRGASPQRQKLAGQYRPTSVVKYSWKFLVFAGWRELPCEGAGSSHPSPMNLLVVGSDTSELLKHLPDQFLYIDDKADIPLPKRARVTRLDLSTHSYNPLKGMDYTKAREFISILDAVFPEGANTLTKKSSNFELLKALVAKPKHLETLIPRGTDAGTLDAYQKIQTILLSPVLRQFLTNPTNFSFKGTILAELDRTVLSEFDCFLIANLLISNYRGTVVIPDYGFYACTFHTQLIRQNRLMVGVRFLDEVKHKNHLLLMKRKIASRCTHEDARTLAEYKGLVAGTNAYTDFIQRSVAWEY